MFATVLVNVTAGGINYELEVHDASIAEELKIKSHDFPCDFIFGAGSSAAQVIKYIGLQSTVLNTLVYPDFIRYST